MNVLYLGKYKVRFRAVINYIKDLPHNSSVLELCFGDIFIANFCKKKGYKWTGVDLNKGFVDEAKKRGYESFQQDITSLEIFPKADICIMIGSLYHFHYQIFSLLSKMFTASDVVIISEPVLNLSNSNGIIGYLAKRAANAGKGNEEFRYNETTLLATLNEHSNFLNYNIASIQYLGKDLIIKLLKNGSN